MTSLRSRTRVCRHTVVCGRLAGGMGPGASPGASPFLPPAFLGGVGFCCGAPPGAPAFCFPVVWGACSWVARLAGWLAFRAVAPHFCAIVVLFGGG